MILFTNGNIYTQNKRTVSSMRIHQGVILEIGDHLKVTPQDTVIDLQGKLVLPGFHDAHCHFYFAAELTDTVDCQTATSLDAIKQRFENAPHALYGWGFNEGLWETATLPTKTDLDAIRSDEPLCLLRSCFHVAIVNSETLSRMGIHKGNIPTVEGGHVAVDAFGEPTGVFYENARDLVLDFFSDITPTETIKHRIKSMIQTCHTYGITTIHTNDIKLGKPGFETLESTFYDVANTEQSMRFIQQISVQDHEVYASRVAQGWQRYKDTPFYTTGPLKLFLDGSLGARTARLFTPYTDDLSTQGMWTLSQEMLSTYFSHFPHQIVTHAIGDAACHRLIQEIITQDKDNRSRHAVIHLQVAQDADLALMKTHRIPAITQPSFRSTDLEMAMSRLGTQRMQSAYHYAHQDALGYTIAYSSDAPVESFDVIHGIKQAIETGVDVWTAIDHYTKDAAWMAFKEDCSGTLIEGYDADFIILDHIDTLNVLETYVHGTQVYKKLDA